MRRFHLAFAAAALLAAVSCGDQIQGPSQTTNVSMRDNNFSPQTILIDRGTTVRWTNNGTVAHNTVGSGNAWNSGNLQPGALFTRQFNTTGTFDYECTLHPGMTGRVIVD